jgi:hypothetical protein
MAPQVQQKQSFLGKLGGALGKVGQVALPIALNAYGNGPQKKPLQPLQSRQFTLPGFNAG